MPLPRKPLALLAVALLSATVYAQRAQWLGPGEPPAAQHDVSDLPPSAFPGPGGRIETAPNLPNDYGVGHDQVGDADSFGRNVRWLGYHAMQIVFSTTCPRANAPEYEICKTIASVDGAQGFDVMSPEPLRLPAGASRSLLCHWMSPRYDMHFQNATSARRTAMYWMRPKIVIVSQALNDPAAISSINGQPYQGKLVIEMYSHLTMLQRPIEAGTTMREANRSSQACLGGALSRRMLIEGYGLSEDVADALFREPMDVYYGVSGWYSQLSAGYLTMGVRFVGD